SKWSYIPQNLQIASLTCKFEALSSAGRPADGYCNPEDVYVPPYTKATITGGTLYLEKYPAYDEYFVAYAREETYNISHLFFSIQVKPCENKRIPNTGISLRSPLKGSESVDAATSYVFTGNSLRIPAIGLGMETPIPIVHVYYEEGSNDMEWDLSTLGNYVGELEGGAYLPYAGNSALTGHYFSAGVFKNLEHLNMEDEIIVFGNDGIKYTYKVIQKFIAQPTDVYEMFQQVGERSLTLVTCENYNLVTDEYERRQIIRATIDSMEPYVVNW
ncbi:MAG: sortase, partial [Anaerolineaceae bacterium]|nr:sortase [Anaerolineaceae bacterium]